MVHTAQIWKLTNSSGEIAATDWHLVLDNVRDLQENGILNPNVCWKLFISYRIYISFPEYLELLCAAEYISVDWRQESQNNASQIAR